MIYRLWIFSLTSVSHVINFVEREHRCTNYWQLLLLRLLRHAVHPRRSLSCQRECLCIAFAAFKLPCEYTRGPGEIYANEIDACKEPSSTLARNNIALLYFFSLGFSEDVSNSERVAARLPLQLNGSQPDISEIVTRVTLRALFHATLLGYNYHQMYNFE